MYALLCLSQKPEQAAERGEKELTVKRRTMGNIKLIGELYKQKMIPEKIVHACLQQLLGDPKADPIEENTEALVHLLTTVSPLPSFILVFLRVLIPHACLP